MKRFPLLLLLVLIGCWSDPEPIRPVVRENPALAAAGGALADGLAACGVCHGAAPLPGAPLSGGVRLKDRYGEVSAPNITPSASGIGSWDVIELMNAIRGSVRPDGSTISPDFHRAYEWMSDKDAMAIVAYLQSSQPVKNDVPRREIGFIDRNTLGLFQRAGDEISGYVPEVEKSDRAAYGRYLAESIAACGTCHHSPAGIFGGSERWVGGAVITFGEEERIAPDISRSQVNGIGGWTESQLVRYLKSGETPDGARVDHRFCPIPFYSNADEDDLKAIAEYLLSKSRS